MGRSIHQFLLFSDEITAHSICRSCRQRRLTKFEKQTNAAAEQTISRAGWFGKRRGRIFFFFVFFFFQEPLKAATYFYVYKVFIGPVSWQILDVRTRRRILRRRWPQPSKSPTPDGNEKKTKCSEHFPNENGASTVNRVPQTDAWHVPYGWCVCVYVDFSGWRYLLAGRL